MVRRDVGEQAAIRRATRRSAKVLPGVTEPLPARTPRIDERGDDDQGDDGDRKVAPPASGFDLSSVIAPVVATVVSGFFNGSFKMPNLAEMLDWRQAARKAAQEKAAKSESAPPTAKPASAAADRVLGARAAPK